MSRSSPTAGAGTRFSAPHTGFRIGCGGWCSTAPFSQATPEPVQKLSYDLLVPHPMSYFEQAMHAPALSSLGLPVSYLAGAEDLAMPPWAQPVVCGRTISTGHSA
jgi:hypothetical protein